MSRVKTSPTGRPSEKLFDVDLLYDDNEFMYHHQMSNEDRQGTFIDLYTDIGTELWNVQYEGIQLLIFATVFDLFHR